MASNHRLLVMGATGMCGHVTALEAVQRFDTWATVHQNSRAIVDLRSDHVLTNVDARDDASVDRAIREAQPTTVINCIGIVKQRDDVGLEAMKQINTALPHHLARRCDDIGARLIHISTDCVFSGLPDDRPHGYSEVIEPDPCDDYGRTKVEGEIHHAPHVTIRTSMIGPEMTRASGLFEWFMAATGPVRGFANAWFTGLGTPTLAGLILDIAASPASLTGLYHVPAPRINKLDLLRLLRDRFRPNVEVVSTPEPRIDRCLDGRRLAAEMGLRVPSWTEMLDTIAQREDKDAT